MYGLSRSLLLAFGPCANCCSGECEEFGGLSPRPPPHQHNPPLRPRCCNRPCRLSLVPLVLLSPEPAAFHRRSARAARVCEKETRALETAALVEVLLPGCNSIYCKCVMRLRLASASHRFCWIPANAVEFLLGISLFYRFDFKRPSAIVCKSNQISLM